jgi:hypothetical protein
MPFEDYLDFLDELRKPMLYALDEITSGGWRIPDDVFFTSMCAPFDAEDEHGVGEALESADKLVAIVAPPGGGKTTIIRKELRERKIEPRQYFLFDFKEQIEQFYSMGRSSEERVTFIRDQFKRELAKQFLDDLDAKINFVYTALQLFFYEERMHRRILIWRKEKSDPDIGKAGTDREALRSVFSSDWGAILEEEEFVRKNLTCAQMAIAVKSALDLPRFLLIIDNVDRLQVGAQPQLFSAAVDIHHGGHGEFGTIVAIRSKNLMRFEEAGSAGDVVRIVSLSQVVEETRPVRLHAPTATLARTILESRQAFALGTLTSTDAKDPHTEARQLFTQLAPLANDRFVADQLYNIANHSIKKLLTLNLDFLKYLCRLVGAGTIPYKDGVVVLADWQVHSYLYRWLFASQTTDQPFLLDVVSKFERFAGGTLRAASDCDIELVVLAWLSERDARFVRLSEITRAFCEIGIAPESVITSIYKMYDVELLHRYIELSDSEEHIALEYCFTADPHVSLNPLGREFVGNTITKLEFLHRCLVYTESRASESPQIFGRADTDIDKKVNAVVRHLRMVQEAHAASIASFAAAASHMPDFEAFYRKEFCVGGQLILERLAISHLTYLKKQHGAAFLAWRSEYADILDALYKAVGSTHTAHAVLGHLLADK